MQYSKSTFSQSPFNSPSTSPVIDNPNSILQSYECHFTWAVHYPLTLSELNHGIFLLTEKFQDEASEIDEALAGVQRRRLRSEAFNPFVKAKKTNDSANYFICVAANKLTQGYMYMKIGKHKEGSGCLEEVEKFLRIVADDESDESLLFPWEYATGFEYVIEGIRAHTRGHIGGLREFRKLPAKAKYVVWTIRDLFFVTCRRANVERPDWMEMIVEMEPYVPRWHFYLYRGLHGSRCVDLPSTRMFRSLDPGKRLQLQQEGIISYQPMVTNQQRGGEGVKDALSICYKTMCVCQMFLERRSQVKKSCCCSSLNQYSPCRFAGVCVESESEALGFVQEKTIELLEMDCHLDGIYLDFSEMHLLWLGPEHQSVELGLRCLKKALRLSSGNPRTHFRMGLANFKLKNHKQAVDHFREAIKNPNNIGGLFGLLQLLMAEPYENGEEIERVLKYGMKNRELTKVWDKRCLRTLHYLKGCFHFMIMEKDVEEAVTSWIIAHDNKSEGNREWGYYFHNLSHQSARFGWPTKRLNLTNVSKTLKHVAYLERTQFRALLLGICDEVDDAISRDCGNKF